ncbi:AraC family transcriptional regulator [Nocardioides albertanoniae]|uniref:AraC family transcriptional regulator n=1 Tax=Nocardioides albertanoniae TaxID=1175486 RepID=UPI001B877166|nr:AraC family transcriptional regulator [Nocardioides albertanoniae]
MSALLLARLGMEHGLTAADALAGTRLRLDDLTDPKAEVSARQELAIVANLVDAYGEDTGLGLEAGSRYHLTAYGIWGFMLVSSPTPRNAVETALRYVDLTFAFCEISAQERDGELLFVLDASDLPRPLRRFLLEREAAAIRTMQREAFPEGVRPTRAAFAFPKGRTAADDLLGTSVEYDAAETVLAYDGSVLDAPMPQANEHAVAMAIDQCRDLLQRRLARTGLSGQVRNLVLARLTDPPDADEIAATLNLSPRTFQRRLADEGTSFRALLGEVREQLAEVLLETGDLPVAEVARLLGYVEVSSFSQAFRRWKGIGPREWRKRAGPAAQSM